MAEKKLSVAERLYSGHLSYDFMKARKGWFIFSGVLVALTILIVVFRGLTLGIEFRGGTDFQAPMTIEATTVDDVRSHLNELTVQDLEAQVFSLGTSNIRVQTRSLTPDEITTTRAEIATLAGVEPGEVTYNSIGASWGKQITERAAVALVVFVGLVMLLIAVYFRDWKMSISAIVAVLHDLVVTVGVYAAVGFTVTPATVIAVLTILGYSLYDTVVVFDKIRENTAGLEHTDRTYSYEANRAINQVLVRSLNTTVIGVIPVLALFIAGTSLQSDPLADLGLALLVGMIAGAYSSLFIAAPLLAWLREREPKMVEHRAQIEHRRARAAAKAAHRESVAAAAGPVAERAAVVGEPGARQPRRTNVSRADRKKGK